MNHRSFKLNIKYHQFNRSEKGSFTIESTLIFPVIFLLTVSFLFISIFMYQKVTLFYIASQAAERTAYNWNNSYKDPFTGEFQMGESDGLYWRLTDDRLLDLLLVLSNQYEPSQVTLDSPASSNELPKHKLQRMASKIPNAIEGKLIYQNSIYKRSIIVELESPIKMPSFVSDLIGNKINARASAHVHDPVEFIRTVDLVLNYSDMLKEQGGKILKIQKDREK
jgi:hypothetical protein